MGRCRELGGGLERVTQVVMWTDRVHSRATGTWYKGVRWNDVGNLRAVGTCHAGVIVERCGTSRVAGTCDAGVLQSVLGNLLEICRHDGKVLQ